jgi:hypothetical protein
MVTLKSARRTIRWRNAAKNMPDHAVTAGVQRPDGSMAVMPQWQPSPIPTGEFPGW